MSKDIIKKAFADAEKEQQEQEINKIKSIVKSYLKEIDEKQKEKTQIEEDIKLLKKDLDDLKSGRLDKIEERQRVDEKASKTSLIIVERIHKEYVPMYPWQCPFTIVLKGNQWNTGLIGSYTTTGSSNTAYLTSGTANLYTGSNNTLTLTGTTCSNFVGGTYDLGNKIINL